MKEINYPTADIGLMGEYCIQCGGKIVSKNVIEESGCKDYLISIQINNTECCSVCGDYVSSYEASNMIDLATIHEYLKNNIKNGKVLAYIRKVLEIDNNTRVGLFGPNWDLWESETEKIPHGVWMWLLEITEKKLRECNMLTDS